MDQIDDTEIKRKPWIPAYFSSDPRKQRLEGFAQQMRSAPTPIESIVHKVLKRIYGYKFEQQKVIPPFILDFYCDEIRLCIEVDGKKHLKTREADKNRDKWLMDNHGITVIRFWGRECFNRTATKAIRRYLRHRRIGETGGFCHCGQRTICYLSECPSSITAFRA